MTAATVQIDEQNGAGAGSPTTNITNTNMGCSLGRRAICRVDCRLQTAARAVGESSRAFTADGVLIVVTADVTTDDATLRLTYTLPPVACARQCPVVWRRSLSSRGSVKSCGEPSFQAVNRSAGSCPQLGRGVRCDRTPRPLRAAARASTRQAVAQVQAGATILPGTK